MRYLTIALSAEGSTDEAFLSPVIYRTAFGLVRSATIQEQILLLSRSSSGNNSRARQCCQYAEWVDIFIMHADAATAAIPRVTTSIIEAIRLNSNRACNLSRDRIVGLVTVCEMESWALACCDTIAQSVGFGQWPQRLPRPCETTETEKLDDPKQTLDQAFHALGQRIQGNELNDALGVIGDSIPLSKLEKLTSYQRFRDELSTTIQSLSGR